MTSFADSAIKNPSVFLRSLTCTGGFSIRQLETEKKNTVIFPSNFYGNIWRFILSLPMDSLNCGVNKTPSPSTAK